MTAGLRVPFCCGMTQDNVFYSFEAQAGRPAVVILAGRLSAADVAATASAFDRCAEDFAGRDADVILMVDANSPHVPEFSSSPYRGLKVIYCLSEFLDRCGFDNLRPAVFVMDRNQRLVASIDLCGDANFVSSARALIAGLPTEKPCDVVLPAPVLMIPNILDTALCRTLMEEFESSVHLPGGMASLDRFGNAIHKIDVDKKRRQDYVLLPESPNHSRVSEALCAACLPEMKKAFQFEACYMDRLLIARYDETGGYFRRHRDNTAPSVAFRQFALSVNLNTDEYDGGYLEFPEYNGHRYRAARGAGIIFSASLLHEATPVIKGRRYVLLTFFHNAQSEAQRLAA